MRPVRLLLWRAVVSMLVDVSRHIVAASVCLSGSDIFSSVLENSLPGQFIADIGITSEPGASAVRLCLTGTHAEWFYLDGRTIRLNSSASRVLDREVLGPVLLAELTCFEDDIMQSHFRILVEVLNENDNKPIFVPETIRPISISELSAVNSVVFKVTADDADGDTIRYMIDQSSEDAWFFRIDLPNSGSVVLDKPLDYETKPHLELIMWAQETLTVETFNTSAVVTVTIQDGDDQYPRFLPCTPVSPDVPVCVNPTYTANVTHTHQDVVLDFSPGPIKAEDGDRGIDSPLVYSILSGDDEHRFVIDNQTGEIRLTRPVGERRLAPNFTLSIMVCQLDDGLKYSVASALVRVLSENKFPPVFNKTTYKGFLIQSSSPASIVSTYGNQVLQIQVSDRDFSNGVNPNIRYLLRPPSGLYQVTQDGVLIARSDQLRAFDRHLLQVTARDEESGEEVSASVDVEVLQRGQTVPHGALREQYIEDSRLIGGVSLLLLLLLLMSSFLVFLLRSVRRKRHQVPGTGKLSTDMNSSPPVFLDESSYPCRSFRQPSPSRPVGYHGSQGVYTRKQSLLPPPPPPVFVQPASSDLLVVVERQGGGTIICDVTEPHKKDNQSE